MRKFDIFNPDFFLDPLLRAAFQSGLTAVEQSEAIFPFEASLHLRLLLEIRAPGKPKSWEIQTPSKGHRETHCVRHRETHPFRNYANYTPP